MADKPAGLHIRAVDLEDLSVLSSMVQDALVPPGDIAYLPSEGHFMMALNRFRWEAAGDAPPYSRTHSGLRLDKVTAVQRRGFSRWEKDKMLSLLSIAYADDEDGGAGGGTVMLTFAGDAAIRLSVSALSVALDDLGEPWPTEWKPGHQPD